MNEKNIIRILDWNMQTGFRILLRQFKEPVYWHIRRITVNNEDAQDATQETFIRVFRYYGQFDHSKSLIAWIYRIATNEALRIAGKRKETLDIDGSSEAMELIADEYIDLKDVEAVNLQKAIRALPRKQQMTFNLRYYDEMSFDKIAEITETTPNGAKANWHQAKIKVYNYLKAYYE